MSGSYEVTSAWVQAARHVAAEEEVEHRVPAEELDDERVERELDDHVEGHPARRGLIADEAGPEGVEKDLECAEERTYEDVD